jgi:hypothetical protein
MKTEAKEALLFLKKKKQKNFCDAGPWALASPQPMAPRHRKFLWSFFKKERLSSANGSVTTTPQFHPLVAQAQSRPKLCRYTRK